jgi:hypothetical protein
MHQSSSIVCVHSPRYAHGRNYCWCHQPAMVCITIGYHRSTSIITYSAYMFMTCWGETSPRLSLFVSSFFSQPFVPNLLMCCTPTVFPCYRACLSSKCWEIPSLPRWMKDRVGKVSGIVGGCTLISSFMLALPLCDNDNGQGTIGGRIRNVGCRLYTVIDQSIGIYFRSCQ